MAVIQARIDVAHATPVHSGTSARRRSIGPHVATTARVAAAAGVAQSPHAAIGVLYSPAAVRLPAIRSDPRPCAACLRVGFRRTPLQSRMGAMTVVITLEIKELRLQISGRPEEGAVQTF